jgi:hypothetical protein
MEKDAYVAEDLAFETEARRGEDMENQTTGARRDHHARLLMARLAALPRFASVTQTCGREHHPGVDEVPEWQIWTQRATTHGQLLVEEYLESVVHISSYLLHVGAGNSSLGQRLAPKVARVLATTLHDEETTYAEGLRIENYFVVKANKFSKDMDQINGPFDFICDPNPSSFACCLFHFSRMMISYTELLSKNGGLLLTEKRGLGWSTQPNDPQWALQWEDWAQLGEILRMPVRQVTDRVYSMHCAPDSGIAALEPSNMTPSLALDPKESLGSVQPR